MTGQAEVIPKEVPKSIQKYDNSPITIRDFIHRWMAPLFEASKGEVLTTPPIFLLLCCLGKSKIDRAGEILSELRKQGEAMVGGKPRS